MNVYNADMQRWFDVANLYGDNGNVDDNDDDDDEKSIVISIIIQ